MLPRHNLAMPTLPTQMTLSVQVSGEQIFILCIESEQQESTIVDSGRTLNSGKAGQRRTCEQFCRPLRETRTRGHRHSDEIQPSSRNLERVILPLS